MTSLSDLETKSELPLIDRSILRLIIASLGQVDLTNSYISRGCGKSSAIIAFSYLQSLRFTKTFSFQFHTQCLATDEIYIRRASLQIGGGDEVKERNHGD